MSRSTTDRFPFVPLVPSYQYHLENIYLYLLFSPIDEELKKETFQFLFISLKKEKYNDKVNPATKGSKLTDETT